MPHKDWVFWLKVTYISLGIVVLLAVLAVGYGLAHVCAFCGPPRL